jgi:hypothetical protein
VGSNPTPAAIVEVMARKTGTWLKVPFDWRRPTRSRVKARWWNPKDRRLVTPKTFGWGYSFNLYEALRRLGLR